MDYKLGVFVTFQRSKDYVVYLFFSLSWKVHFLGSLTLVQTEQTKMKIPPQYTWDYIFST